MNKKQKILTGITIVILAIWAAMFASEMNMGEKYREPSGYFIALFFFVAAYIGLFFIVKTK